MSPVVARIIGTRLANTCRLGLVARSLCYDAGCGAFRSARVPPVSVAPKKLKVVSVV